MDESKYLENVIDKLNKKIGEIDEVLEYHKKDIKKMNDYYWQNYNEFDEYGYEHYDYKQSMLNTVNEKSDRIKERHRYEKMLESPYFARVDFMYEGETLPESYYIGIGSFSPKASDIPLVFDWRAPVSSLFYDYDKGKASFEAPNGIIDGEITVKKQYKIKNGKMLYFFESDINIDDDILKKELSMNGSDRLKSIVTTIQKQQNAIIRDKNSKILVVQGTAGSGKTSIALHRMAYLLYHNRNTISAENILILSPNGVFADYIAHILPELNEENISEMSFDDFASKQLSEVGRCQDRYDSIEDIMKWGYGKYTKYKQSSEFVSEINGYVLELESYLVKFSDVVYKNIDAPAHKIEKMFYEKFTETPLMKRIDAIAEYIIDEAETLSGKNFDEIELEIINDKFRRLYKTKDILKLYKKFLHLQDIEWQEGRKGEILYEDVYPILYLKYQLFGVKAHENVKHLLIDEMQDYSYVQYAIIEEVFKCQMTILGDLYQSIGDEKVDVAKYIRKIFGRDVNYTQMKKSYRQTMEIGKFAANIIGQTDIDFFERSGKEPLLKKYDDFEYIIADLKLNIEGQLSEGYETIAVLCMNIESATLYYNQLKETMENVHFIDKESVRFSKGITVTTFYLSKGLEFDCVHVPDYGAFYEKDEFGKQALYISATRAMHRLDMYELKC